MTQYRVVGHCAHVKTNTPQGRMTLLLTKGSVLPADASADQIAHLLSVNLIEPIGGVLQAEAEDASVEDGAEHGPSEERLVARAKLPADGSMPHHNSGQPVWVEYLAGKGYDYDALQGQEKAALIELAKNAT